MVWDIDPVLLDLGILQLRYYGICWMIGLFLGFWIARKTQIVQQITPEKQDKIFIIMVISVVIFAHLVHILFYEPSSIWRNPIRIIQIGSGLASHGGVLGAILAFYWFSRKEKISFLGLADVVSFCGLYTGGFIRIGNFFNSEIIGNPTDVPWAVVFARVAPEPRHPTQLYEALFLFILAGLTTWFYFKVYRKEWEGIIFGIFMFSYFTFRVIVEIVKEYQSELESGGFTMGQVLSIPYILYSLVILIRIYKNVKAGKKV